MELYFFLRISQNIFCCGIQPKIHDLVSKQTKKSQWSACENLQNYFISHFNLPQKRTCIVIAL